MNRAQKRAMPKILAAKVGGKKKLAAMLEEAKQRARAEDAEKERAGHGVENPNLLREAADREAQAQRTAAATGESDFDDKGGA
jgi:hypothetical protein